MNLLTAIITNLFGVFFIGRTTPSVETLNRVSPLIYPVEPFPFTADRALKAWIFITYTHIVYFTNFLGLSQSGRLQFGQRFGISVLGNQV